MDGQSVGEYDCVVILPRLYEREMIIKKEWQQQQLTLSQKRIKNDNIQVYYKSESDRIW